MYRDLNLILYGGFITTNDITTVHVIYRVISNENCNKVMSNQAKCFEFIGLWGSGKTTLLAKLQNP